MQLNEDKPCSYYHNYKEKPKLHSIDGDEKCKNSHCCNLLEIIREKKKEKVKIWGN